MRRRGAGAAVLFYSGDCRDLANGNIVGSGDVADIIATRANHDGTVRVTTISDTDLGAVLGNKRTFGRSVTSASFGM